MASAVPGSKEVYDVIVVGSGATGGWAAKELTEAGLRVALVEAGRNLVPEKDFTEHVLPYQVKYRGRSPKSSGPGRSSLVVMPVWNTTMNGSSTIMKILIRLLRTNRSTGSGFAFWEAVRSFGAGRAIV